MTRGDPTFATRDELVASPYFITGPALISFSGGRTSGYMLKQILDAHGGTLPDDVHVCFANTGKEREETLRFVHECGTRWNVPIVWLERNRAPSDDGDLVTTFDVVGFNSASRNGEPFSALIRQKRYLPNSVTRYCTIELKIRVMRDFARSLGWKNWSNVVGLRADEMHRVQRAQVRNAAKKDPWVTATPLADAGVSNRDVRSFWQKQPFDLNLLPFEGNCDGCFLKARPKLWETERTKPGTLQWWAEAEAEATAITGKTSGARFVTEYSYAELIRDVQRQPDMFAGGLFDEDPEMDAECGLWCAGEAA